VTELPTEHLLQAIDEGQRHRGWIANGYAQVEYLLGDIITKAFKIPEYAALITRLPHRVEKRVKLVRSILDIEGFFSKYHGEITWILEAFEARHETRNLLAHGFCTAYHTPDGDFGLEFRKWHRDGDNDAEMQRTFRLIDLEYERAQLVDVSQRALTLSLQIHSELGLVGP
jgi:hypothetical protein